MTGGNSLTLPFIVDLFSLKRDFFFFFLPKTRELKFYRQRLTRCTRRAHSANRSKIEFPHVRNNGETRKVFCSAKLYFRILASEEIELVYYFKYLFIFFFYEYLPIVY